MAELRRGFKAQADRLVLEVRSELGLAADCRLDPVALAAHYGIPVFSIEDLEVTAECLRHFQGDGEGEFSAMTVLWGHRKLIVVNLAHASSRRANSIAHEVSHVILEHEPTEIVAMGGCRRWDAIMEAEADRLGGALLVPEEAALRIARSGTDLESAALEFGVSAALMRKRLNETGAFKRARRRWG